MADPAADSATVCPEPRPAAAGAVTTGDASRDQDISV